MRFKVGAVVGALSVIVGSREVMAQRCSCPTFDLAEAVKNADAIFVGKSLSATSDSSAPVRDGAAGWKDAGIEYQTRLTFDVQTVVKGNLPRFAEVINPTGPCGFGFSVGERYLIMGTGRGAAVTTDSCKGNLSGSEAIEARSAAIQNLLDANDR